MKNPVIFGLAVSMIVSSAVYAAPAKKAAARTAKKAAVVKAVKPAQSATATQAKAAVAEPTQTVAEPTAGSPASSAESVTQVAKATQEVKKSKFNILIADRGSFATATSNRSETSEPSGVLTVRPGYKLSDDVSLAAGIDITHTFGAAETAATDSQVSRPKWTPADVYLMAAHSNLGTLPGNLKTKGYLRYYLPTSEASQFMGQIGVVRGNITLAKPIGNKLAVKYIAEPRLYLEQYKTYDRKDETGTIQRNAKGEAVQVGTNTYRLNHFVEVEFNATEKLGFYSDLGFDHKWYNGDSNYGLRSSQRDNIYAETGVAYSFTNNVTLIAGVEQDGPDLRNQAQNNEASVIYGEDFTNYFLEADITF